MRTVASSMSPSERKELQLEVFTQQEGHVIEGVLRTPDRVAVVSDLARGSCFLSGPMQPDLTDFCSRHGLPKPATVAEPAGSP